MNKHISFRQYADMVKRSDIIDHEDGLYLGIVGFSGEVGDLVSALKKKEKNEAGYYDIKNKIDEEIGDCLWYCFKIAESSGIGIEKGFAAESNCSLDSVNIESVLGSSTKELVIDLVALSGEIANEFRAPSSKISDKLSNTLVNLKAIANQNGSTLSRAAVKNMRKVTDRYLTNEPCALKLYDEDFPEYEKLPRELDIDFREHGENDKFSIMYIRGLRYGSPLTDNSAIADDYRFHDVFHFSHLANLGWSPTIRMLLKLKRKSDPLKDEVDDGAKAIIIEESICHFIFKYGKRNNFDFRDRRIDTSVLKTIRFMVDGLEVADRPLSLWEKTIKDGFDMFNMLRKHREGRISIDVKNRSISFKEIPENSVRNSFAASD